MALSINTLSASGMTTSAQNTLAFVSAHFELSLFKVEAPLEFQGLGSALSPQRRMDAECGLPHQTARRLGALFEQILPPIPNLVKAYGSRVSEISKSSTLNPRGSQRDGVFASHTGADGTSIWAAATSGNPAIAIHLLACMLARTFPPSEATSIWYEIVQNRREEIKAGVQVGMIGSVAASIQGIDRHDLMQWDASARAWLQTADDAKQFDQKQLTLILDNINLPISPGKTAYDNVISAWTTAMLAVEKLVTGQPQRVLNGAVLLALTSWHLFPDLLVLQTKTVDVRFHDNLIASGGRLTIGLENVGSGKGEGIYWSLALSHLRYYGDPVTVSRSIGFDASRITIPQLHLLAFGSLLASWGDSGSDEIIAARFFVSLWHCLERSSNKLRCPETNHHKFLLSSSSWLFMLTGAAKMLLTSEDINRATAMKLTKLGRRRGSMFLAAQKMWLPPLFGLSHISILATLSDYSMFSAYKMSPRLAVLRMIATSLNLRPTECLIRRPLPTDKAGMKKCYEYMTAVPVLGSDSSSGHRWWIETESGRTLNTVDHYFTLDGELDQFLAPDTFDKLPLELASKEMRWRMKIPRATSGKYRLQDYLIRLSWKPDRVKGTSIYDTFLEDTHSATYNVIAGDVDDIALFVECTQDFRKRQRDIKEAFSKGSRSSWIGVEQMTEVLNSDSVCPELVLEYLVSLSTRPDIILPDLSREIRIRTYDVQLCMRSLNALSIATRIYDGLPGATVAADIIIQPLHSAHWIPIEEIIFPHPKPLLKRENVFSCIAMLESGTYNIPPDDLKEVMAISARNSLYVSQALLCDPYETSHINDVTLILGNVGRSGMVLMVAPIAPRLRAMDLQHWEVVNHDAFTFQEDDCFPSTTLHLSFTDYELPLKIGDHGAIDHDVAIVETVISVHDGGKWIGDIDVLALFQSNNHLLRRFQHDTECSHSDRVHHKGRLTSIASWEEIIDAPEDLGQDNIGVLRAHNNWQARQAAACISIQRGFQTVILPPQRICWNCCCTAEWEWVPPLPPSVLSKEAVNTANAPDTEAGTTEKLVQDLPDDSEGSDQADGSDSSTGSDDSNVTTIPFETPDAYESILEFDSITRLQTQVMIY
ncbi:hypothetical protein MMC11_000846 [Xylographa trunciseda]|nr:hypothetical protein [Xylographa trunciseda]